MFIDRLLNQGNAPVLEQAIRFTEKRSELLAENVAGVNVPNYKQRDLDLTAFQVMLAGRVDQKNAAAPGTTRFDDLTAEVMEPTAGKLLSHDGNNRSMEELMSDVAQNTLMHNMFTEILRKQYGDLDMALRERVG